MHLLKPSNSEKKQDFFNLLYFESKLFLFSQGWAILLHHLLLQLSNSEKQTFENQGNAKFIGFQGNMWSLNQESVSTIHSE